MERRLEGTTAAESSWDNGGNGDGRRMIANDIDFILFCLISFPQDSSFSIFSRVFTGDMWNIYTFTVLTFALHSYS